MLMADKKFEENAKIPSLHLGGELPVEIVEAFRRQCGTTMVGQSILR